jgi:AcrR family transcriptional regulator
MTGPVSRPRRAEPLGVRTGGAAWTRVHAAIAAAGLEILADRGYGGFTVDAVSEASGIARRTIYRHYPTRLSLAVAALRQLPTMDGWWPSSGAPRERLRAALRHGASFPVRLPQLLATAMVHRDDAPELLEALHDQVLTPRLKAIDAWVEQGKADGWARPDVHGWQVAALLQGSIDAEVLGLVDFGSARQRADILADTAWALVAVDPDGDGTSLTSSPSRGSSRRGTDLP